VQQHLALSIALGKSIVAASGNKTKDKDILLVSIAILPLSNAELWESFGKYQLQNIIE
jgi:hypothetical protein